MDDVAVNSVRCVEKLGEEQKKAFLSILENNPSKFNESIKLNHLRVFQKCTVKRKQNASVKEAKDQLNLFSQLSVATQIRDGN